MDLSNYNFHASDCARKLDEIEAALGVKFDRKAMFDREQALWVQLNQDWTRRQWVFKFSKDPSVTTATFDDREPGETGITETETHIEYAPHSMVYAKNALSCSLICLKNNIPDIQARRKPKPPEKQMTPQDKETHMHETIARASLVAFAEFIGQPISDLGAVFRQARGLAGGGSMAIVGSIPIDGTKPICVQVIDGRGIGDGVRVDGSSVMASFWLFKSEVMARSLAGCVSGFSRYALDVAGILATERAKLTPPPPKPEPIPFEAECRAHVKTLNAQLGINLNEDVVLAAGEAVRSITPRSSGDETSANYCLSIRKGDRAASFSVTLADPDRGKPRHSGIATFTSNYCAVENGLRCALADIVRNIPRIFSQLTPPPPAKPALTADGMRPGSVAIDRALETTRPPIYVFGGKESDRQSTDNAGFFGALTGGATRLYLTFQRKTDRAKLSINPRVHVHTEPMFFPSEFNTTISAPIDPTNPAATLTALADRIRNENL